MATIEELYRDILEREADAEGLAYWQGQLEGGMSLDDIRSAIYGSEENVRQDIEKTYVSELGRVYDQGGYDYWVNEALNNPNMTLDYVKDAINKSEEGRFLDPTEVLGEKMFHEYATRDPEMLRKYVEAAYWSELGRAPDQEGLDFWVNEAVKNPEQSLASVLQGISRSDEGLAFDETGRLFGGITNEAEGIQPFLDVYGNVVSFNSRTGGYDAGYQMGPSPWEVQARNEAGFPTEYYYNPETVESTGALPGYGYEWSVADGSVDSNYGMYGKRPDETLTQYYQRLANTRQGGILGQGLLSASPTVGSEAWEALKQIETETGDTSLSQQLANTQLSSSGGYSAGLPDINRLQGLLDWRNNGMSPEQAAAFGLFGGVTGLPIGQAISFMSDMASSDLSGTAVDYLDRGYITEDQYNQFLNNIMQPESMINRDYEAGRTQDSSTGTSSGDSWRTPGGYTGERGVNVPPPK